MLDPLSSGAVRATTPWCRANVPQPRLATVLVAHSYPLIRAGLASLLQSLPGCSVRIWPDSPLHFANAVETGAVIVVGDHEALGIVSGQHFLPEFDLADARSKMLVLARPTPSCDPRTLHPSASAYLPIDCKEDDLFDAVSRVLAGAFGRVKAPSGTSRGGLAPAALRRVRDHIEANLAERVELTLLARIAGLSECHFARAFKQSMGDTPHRYITRRRIQAAACLVRTASEPLTHIALKFGFSDQSHFTRTFGRIMGETPSTYRHRHR